LVYGVIVSVAAVVIRYQTGVVIDPFSFHPVFVWGPLVMIGLGALVGVLPARKAYRTPVAESLSGGS